MNKVILMGRLTRDPEVRYTSGENSLAIARYTLAVDRKIRKDGDATADFIPCVVFGRSAEFVEKYFRKGLKITIVGLWRWRSSMILLMRRPGFYFFIFFFTESVDRFYH